MSGEEKNVWGIHTQDDSLFLQEGVIAIGWKEMGDLLSIRADREAFKEKYQSVYPEAKKGSIPGSAGMLYRFVCEIKIGDYVIFPSKSDRMINIGIVEGGYEYRPLATEYVHQHKVKWVKHLPRTSFSQGALYELGAIMTFFSIKTYAEEYLGALDKGFKRKALMTGIDEDESVGLVAEQIVEGTRDYILKELSRQFKGYDLENFVADLLRTMGYRTIVSPHGGDSGIDITAYKDELPPRILVQVKSQDSDIKEKEIQSLKGAMREGDYGLFVTLSNYTKNAQKYLDSTPTIRGINGTELVDLILKYYDQLSDENKKKIVLKKVYIAVGKNKEG